jgi:hypothetical protein
MRFASGGCNNHLIAVNGANIRIGIFHGRETYFELKSNSMNNRKKVAHFAGWAVNDIFRSDRYRITADSGKF